MEQDNLVAAVHAFFVRFEVSPLVFAVVDLVSAQRRSHFVATMCVTRISHEYAEKSLSEHYRATNITIVLHI